MVVTSSSRPCPFNASMPTLWKDADPDIPILIAAKTEYAKLKMIDGNPQKRLAQPMLIAPGSRATLHIRIRERSPTTHLESPRTDR
jgi:hypothetical protein